MTLCDGTPTGQPYQQSILSTRQSSGMTGQGDTIIAILSQHLMGRVTMCYNAAGHKSACNFDLPSSAGHHESMPPLPRCRWRVATEDPLPKEFYHE